MISDVRLRNIVDCLSWLVRISQVQLEQPCYRSFPVYSWSSFVGFIIWTLFLVFLLWPVILWELPCLMAKWLLLSLLPLKTIFCRFVLVTVPSPCHFSLPVLTGTNWFGIKRCENKTIFVQRDVSKRNTCYITPPLKRDLWCEAILTILFLIYQFLYSTEMQPELKHFDSVPPDDECCACLQITPAPNQLVSSEAWTELTPSALGMDIQWIIINKSVL